MTDHSGDANKMVRLTGHLVEEITETTTEQYWVVPIATNTPAQAFYRAEEVEAMLDLLQAMCDPESYPDKAICKLLDQLRQE